MAAKGTPIRPSNQGVLERHGMEALDVMAISAERIEVTLGCRAYNPHLLAAGYCDSLTAIPRFHKRALKIKFS